MRPFFAPFLNRGDAISLRVKVLPAEPFPDDAPVCCHFHEIVCVHVAVVFRAGYSTFDPRHKIRGKLSQAKKQHVAVPQGYAIVMVIGVAHFPEDTTVPVYFNRSASFPWLPTDEACRILDNLSIVEESSLLGQIAVIARRVRHLPRVDDP